jgi:hypothetical protein
MSDIHEGECIGGPFDGRKLAHVGERCPIASVSPRAMSAALYGETLAGEYAWDKGTWRWRRAQGGQVQ